MDSDMLEVLKSWFESYYKLVLFIGTVGFGILLVSNALIIQQIENDFVRQAASDSKDQIQLALLLITICLISTMISLITTYNWYVTGLENIMKHSTEDYSYLGDSFTYRKEMGKMEFWGVISLITGWIAGISLFAGGLLYGYSIWDLVIAFIEN